MKYKEELENLRIPGLMLVTALSLVGIISGSQNAVASICPPMCVDVDAEIEAQVENETRMSNQTANGNMTGNMTATNSTN